MSLIRCEVRSNDCEGEESLVERATMVFSGTDLLPDSLVRVLFGLEQQRLVVVGDGGENTPEKRRAPSSAFVSDLAGRSGVHSPSKRAQTSW